MGKKRKPKLPKQRIPVPPPARPHKDEKKEGEKRSCRKKVEEEKLNLE